MSDGETDTHTGVIRHTASSDHEYDALVRRLLACKSIEDFIKLRGFYVKYYRPASSDVNRQFDADRAFMSPRPFETVVDEKQVGVGVRTFEACRKHGCLTVLDSKYRHECDEEIK